MLLSVPFGLLGSFLFVNGVSAIGNISMLKMILGTMSNNIYMQIALIMLMGLLAKNAILIVEFALDRRKICLLYTSVDEGATVRKGQVLFIVDPTQYEAAVRTAKAAVATAEAAVSTPVSYTHLDVYKRQHL